VHTVQELLRTNDPVLISWAEALLAGEGITVFVMDRHMSVLEGSAGAIPRRLMIEDDDFGRARALIEAARTELSMNAEVPWSNTEGSESEGPDAADGDDR
jgi:hypothetical protein